MSMEKQKRGIKMKATAKTRVRPRHGMPILGIIDAGYMILAGILLLLILDFEGLAFLGVGLATLAVCILARFYVLPNYIMLGLAFFNLPLLKIIGAICQAIAGVVFKNVTLTATVTHTPMWGYLAIHSGALLLICAIRWFLNADATDHIRDPLKAMILICAGVVSFDIMAGILGGWLIPWALTKPLAVKIVTIVIYSVVTLLVSAGAVVAAVMIFVKKIRAPRPATASYIPPVEEVVPATEEEVPVVEEAPAEEEAPVVEETAPEA